MGLFDFFKSKKNSTVPVVSSHAPEQSLRSDIKFEIKLTDRQMLVDKETVNAIAERMIAEDPFVKSFQGREDKDIRDGDSVLFEYEHVTTMNVSIEQDYMVIIEGLPLGKLPTDVIDAIKPYYGSTIATIFVYLTGGRNKKRLDSELIENELPYGLTIYIQFN